MTTQAIVGRRHILEYVNAIDKPTIDGDYIRNLAVLGPVSVNPDDPENPNSPKRNYRSIIGATEEVVKFTGPSYVMHEKHLGRKRTDDDKIGEFLNPRADADGILRADLLCRKMVIEGKETYHPQALAIRDNIEHTRPFGGFSATMDYQINTYTGEVKRIDQVESIDYVANPATVRSVVEEDEKLAESDAKKSDELEKSEVSKEEHQKLKGEHDDLKVDHEKLRNEHAQLEEKVGGLFEDHEKLRNEHSALEERMKSCEECMAASRKEATEAKEAIEAARKGQSRTIPEPKKIETKATSFREFIRS